MPLSTLPLRWRLVLILSLFLNLLMIGLIAGSALKGDNGRGRHGPEPLVRALPDADRGEVLRALPRPDRPERRARFEELLDSLRADPFDADRTRALLAEQRRIAGDRAVEAEAAIVSRLSNMSTADREAYADRLASRVRRGGNR